MNLDDDIDMQAAINTGLAWKLEGSFGRAAMRAITDGQCMLGHEGHTDAYGNYVPSRWEVEPGSKGSPEYSGQEIDRGPALEYVVQFGDGTVHTMQHTQLFGVFSKQHLARFEPVIALEVNEV